MYNLNILLLVCVLTVFVKAFNEYETGKVADTDNGLRKKRSTTSFDQPGDVPESSAGRYPDEPFPPDNFTILNLNDVLQNSSTTDAPATLRSLDNTEPVEITHYESNLTVEALIRYAADTNTKFVQFPVLIEADRRYEDMKYLYRLKFSATSANKTELSCEATGYTKAYFLDYKIDATICRTGKGSASNRKFDSLIDETDFEDFKSNVKGLPTQLGRDSVAFYKKRGKLGSTYQFEKVIAVRAKYIYANTQYQFITNFTMKVPVQVKGPTKDTKHRRQVSKDKEVWNCRSSAFGEPGTCRIIVNAVHCDCRQDADLYRFRDYCLFTNYTTSARSDHTESPATLRSLINTEPVEITHFEKNLSVEALIWYAANSNTKFVKLPLLIQAERELKNGKYAYGLKFAATDSNNNELSCESTGFTPKNFLNYSIDATICRSGKGTAKKDTFRSLINETGFKTLKTYKKGLPTKLAKASVSHYKKQRSLGPAYAFEEVKSLRARYIYAKTQYQYITNFTMKVPVQVKGPTKDTKHRRQVSKDKEIWNCRSSAFGEPGTCKIIVNAVHCDCQEDADVSRFKDECVTTTSSTTNSSSTSSTTDKTTTTTAKTTTTTPKSETTKKPDDDDDDNDNDDANDNNGGDNGGSGSDVAGGGSSAVGGTSVSAGDIVALIFSGAAAAAGAALAIGVAMSPPFAAAVASAAASAVSALSGLISSGSAASSASFSAELVEAGESSFLSAEGGINYGTLAEDAFPVLDGEFPMPQEELVFEPEEGLSNPGENIESENQPPVQENPPPGEENPPPGENQPPGEENQPPGEENQPPGEENPAPGENQPPGEENPSPGEENQPPGEENQPPGEENPSPGEENQPPGEENQPPGEENQPPGEENQPPVEENQPSVEENPFPDEVSDVPEQENPFTENAERDVTTTSRFLKRIAPLAGGIILFGAGTLGVSLLLVKIFGEDKTKSLDEYDGYAGTAGVEAMTSFQYMLAGLPFSKKQKRALPIKLYSYTRSLIMGRRLVYSVAYYIKLPKKPWRFCVTVGYHTDQFKEYNYVSVDCNHYIETQFKPYQKTRYESITKDKFSNMTIDDDDLLLKKLESTSARYYKTNQRLFGKFEVRNVKEYLRRSLFHGGQYQYYLNFKIHNKTTQKKMDCVSSVYRQKDFNLPNHFLELYVTAVHCDCRHDADVRRFPEVVKKCPKLKMLKINTTNETPVDYIPKNVTVRVVDTTLFETTLAIDGTQAHWIKKGAVNVTDLKITVTEAVRGYYEDHYEYRLKTFVTNRKGVQFRCVLLANVNWDFRRYLILFSDCIYKGYDGIGLFAPEDYYPSAERLPPIEKQNYSSVMKKRDVGDSDLLLRRLAVQSISYYVHKELLFDKYELVNATELRRMSVYENLQDNYFVSFKMRNVRTRKVWSCSSSVFASADGINLLPGAVHCDCIDDVSAYRFRFNYTDACDVSDTDTTIPPPLYEYNVLPDMQGQVVEVTAFELMMTKTAISIFFPFEKPENIEIREAVLSRLPDRYGYKLKFHVSFPSRARCDCIAVASSYDLIGYEIRIVDCRNHVDVGHDLYQPQEYLISENTSFGLIVEDEFNETQENSFVSNLVLKESFRYYLLKERLFRIYQPGRIIDISSKLIYNGSQYQYFARFQFKNTVNLETWICSSSVFVESSHSETLVGAVHCDCKIDSDRHRFHHIEHCPETAPKYILPNAPKESIEYSIFESKLIRESPGPNPQVERTVFDGHYTYRFKMRPASNYSCISLIRLSLDFSDSRTIYEACSNGSGNYLFGDEDYEYSKNVRFGAIVKDEFDTVGIGLSISVLEKMSALCVRYYKQKKSNQYRMRVKDVLRKTIENGQQYQYYVTFDMETVNNTEEVILCVSSVFAELSHQTLVPNAVHCDCMNDSDAYRFKELDCSTISVSTTTTTVAHTTPLHLQKSVGLSVVDATTKELKLAKMAASKYFGLQYSDMSQFWFYIDEVQRLTEDDQYKYKILFETTAPIGIVFDCALLARSSFDYGEYGVEISDCKEENQTWRGVFNEEDLVPMNAKFDPIITKNSDVYRHFRRIDRLDKPTFFDQSTRFYIRKEKLSKFYLGLRQVSLFERILSEYGSQYFVRFQMKNTITLEVFSCSSSVFKDGDDVLVSAAHCDCRSDSDAYRFRHNEYCPSNPPEYDIPVNSIDTVEVTVLETELLASQENSLVGFVKDLYSLASTQIGLVRTIEQVERYIPHLEKYYAYKLKTKVTTTIRTINCIDIYKVYLNMIDSEWMHQHCYIDDQRSFYGQRDYLVTTNVTLNPIDGEEFYRYGESVDEKLNSTAREKLINTSIEYYEQKEHDQYRWKTLKEALRTSIYNNTQYKYLLKFDMNGNNTEDSLNCTASLFAEVSHQRMLVRAVHCACRNDSDSQRFVNVEEDCQE